MSDKTRYADGWPVRPGDDLADAIRLAVCGGAENVEATGIKPFGELPEYERDDWREGARAAVASLAPDAETLAAAGEVLRLATLRDELEERAGDGDSHAEEGLADLDARLWALALQLAAWVAGRGNK